MIWGSLCPDIAYSATSKKSSKRSNKPNSIIFSSNKPTKKGSSLAANKNSAAKSTIKKSSNDDTSAKSIKNKSTGTYSKLGKSASNKGINSRARFSLKNSVKKKNTKSSYRSLAQRGSTPRNNINQSQPEETISAIAPPPSETEFYSEFNRLSKSYIPSESGGLSHVGPFTQNNAGKYVDTSRKGETVLLTLDEELQVEAEKILAQAKISSGALVALDPRTGKVLALAGHSALDNYGQLLVARNTLPAASLFKIITAAAAVENSGLNSNSEVFYRGGTYSLGRHNYLPSNTQDRLRMDLGKALGKSCNPVFARVALNNLSTDLIKEYANSFGFSKNISQDFPLAPSSLTLGEDKYSLARTAAGFGAAYISPVHGATIAGALGNSGLMMKPYIIDSVVDSSGKIIKRTRPQVLSQIVRPSTASEVVAMMESTVTEGTARKHFANSSSTLKKVSIAGKTGTLKGQSPKGLYLWFVAVAPVENPTIAIAALVIDNGSSRTGGVAIGKKLLERFFNGTNTTVLSKSTETSTERKTAQAPIHKSKKII